MSAPPLLLAEVPGWLRLHLNATTPAALVFYERVPTFPASVPYGKVGTAYSYGEGWDDPPLTRGTGSCGWVQVELRGIGRADVDAVAVLDHARRSIDQLTIGDVVFPSGNVARLGSVLSGGPPSEPVGSGTLQAVTESFRFYLEAVT